MIRYWHQPRAYTQQTVHQLAKLCSSSTTSRAISSAAVSSTTSAIFPSSSHASYSTLTHARPSQFISTTPRTFLLASAHHSSSALASISSSYQQHQCAIHTSAALQKSKKKQQAKATTPTPAPPKTAATNAKEKSKPSTRAASPPLATTKSAPTNKQTIATSTSKSNASTSASTQASKSASSSSSSSSSSLPSSSPNAKFAEPPRPNSAQSNRAQTKPAKGNSRSKSISPTPRPPASNPKKQTQSLPASPQLTSQLKSSTQQPPSTKSSSSPLTSPAQSNKKNQKQSQKHQHQQKSDASSATPPRSPAKPPTPPSSPKSAAASISASTDASATATPSTSPSSTQQPNKRSKLGRPKSATPKKNVHLREKQWKGEVAPAAPTAVTQPLRPQLRVAGGSRTPAISYPPIRSFYHLRSFRDRIGARYEPPQSNTSSNSPSSSSTSGHFALGNLWWEEKHSVLARSILKYFTESHRSSANSPRKTAFKALLRLEFHRRPRNMLRKVQIRPSQAYQNSHGLRDVVDDMYRQYDNDLAASATKKSPPPSSTPTVAEFNAQSQWALDGVYAMCRRELYELGLWHILEKFDATQVGPLEHDKESEAPRPRRERGDRNLPRYNNGIPITSLSEIPTPEGIDSMMAMRAQQQQDALQHVPTPENMWQKWSFQDWTTLVAAERHVLDVWRKTGVLELPDMMKEDNRVKKAEAKQRAKTSPYTVQGRIALGLKPLPPSAATFSLIQTLRTVFPYKPTDQAPNATTEKVTPTPPASPSTPRGDQAAPKLTLTDIRSSFGAPPPDAHFSIDRPLAHPALAPDRATYDQAPFFWLYGHNFLQQTARNKTVLTRMIEGASVLVMEEERKRGLVFRVNPKQHHTPLLTSQKSDPEHDASSMKVESEDIEDAATFELDEEVKYTKHHAVVSMGEPKKAQASTAVSPPNTSTSSPSSSSSSTPPTPQIRSFGLTQFGTREFRLDYIFTRLQVEETRLASLARAYILDLESERHRFAIKAEASARAQPKQLKQAQLEKERLEKNEWIDELRAVRLLPPESSADEMTAAGRKPYVKFTTAMRRYEQLIREHMENHNTTREQARIELRAARAKFAQKDESTVDAEAESVTTTPILSEAKSVSTSAHIIGAPHPLGRHGSLPHTPVPLIPLAPAVAIPSPFQSASSSSSTSSKLPLFSQPRHPLHISVAASARSRYHNYFWSSIHLIQSLEDAIREFVKQKKDEGVWDEMIQTRLKELNGKKPNMKWMQYRYLSNGKEQQKARRAQEREQQEKKQASSSSVKKSSSATAPNPSEELDDPALVISEAEITNVAGDSGLTFSSVPNPSGTGGLNLTKTDPLTSASDLIRAMPDNVIDLFLTYKPTRLIPYSVLDDITRTPEEEEEREKQEEMRFKQGPASKTVASSSSTTIKPPSSSTARLARAGSFESTLEEIRERAYSEIAAMYAAARKQSGGKSFNAQELPINAFPVVPRVERKEIVDEVCMKLFYEHFAHLSPAVRNELQRVLKVHKSQQHQLRQQQHSNLTKQQQQQQKLIDHPLLPHQNPNYHPLHHTDSRYVHFTRPSSMRAGVMAVPHTLSMCLFPDAILETETRIRLFPWVLWDTWRHMVQGVYLHLFPNAFGDLSAVKKSPKVGNEAYQTQVVVEQVGTGNLTTNNTANQLEASPASSPTLLAPSSEVAPNSDIFLMRVASRYKDAQKSITQLVEKRKEASTKPASSSSAKATASTTSPTTSTASQYSSLADTDSLAAAHSLAMSRAIAFHESHLDQIHEPELREIEVKRFQKEMARREQWWSKRMAAKVKRQQTEQVEQRIPPTKEVDLQHQQHTESSSSSPTQEQLEEQAAQFKIRQSRSAAITPHESRPTESKIEPTPSDAELTSMLTPSFASEPLIEEAAQLYSSSRSHPSFATTLSNIPRDPLTRLVHDVLMDYVQDVSTALKAKKIIQLEGNEGAVEESVLQKAIENINKFVTNEKDAQIHSLTAISTILQCCLRTDQAIKLLHAQRITINGDSSSAAKSARVLLQDPSTLDPSATNASATTSNTYPNLRIMPVRYANSKKHAIKNIGDAPRYLVVLTNLTHQQIALVGEMMFAFSGPSSEESTSEGGALAASMEIEGLRALKALAMYKPRAPSSSSSSSSSPSHSVLEDEAWLVIDLGPVLIHCFTGQPKFTTQPLKHRIRRALQQQSTTKVEISLGAAIPYAELDQRPNCTITGFSTILKPPTSIQDEAIGGKRATMTAEANE